MTEDDAVTVPKSIPGAVNDCGAVVFCNDMNPCGIETDPVEVALAGSDRVTTDGTVNVPALAGATHRKKPMGAFSPLGAVPVAMPMMLTKLLDAPPDQFTVTPLARTTVVGGLIHVSAGGICTEPWNAPTSAPPD